MPRFVLLCALLTYLASARAQAQTRVAVTIDDLPAAGVPVPGWSEARILNTLAEVLHAHHVPEVVGFLSGGNMDRVPATKDALEAWLAGGYRLGNHTFSHLSADVVDAQTFERDVARNEVVLRELGESVSYFRYPYLERGTSQDDREIRRYLAQHAYRIADVSLDFQDWAFSAAYGRCTAAGDERALQTLRASYLDYAARELEWSRASLRDLAHRDVPLVLLLHANFMTAQMLDSLLSAYEEAGVRFVSLQEALDDELYERAQTSQHGDGALLQALMRERHLAASNSVRMPHDFLDALCFDSKH